MALIAPWSLARDWPGDTSSSQWPLTAFGWLKANRSSRFWFHWLMIESNASRSRSIVKGDGGMWAATGRILPLARSLLHWLSLRFKRKHSTLRFRTASTGWQWKHFTLASSDACIVGRNSPVRSTPKRLLAAPAFFSPPYSASATASLVNCNILSLPSRWAKVW